MTLILQRVTTEYVADEDRIRLSGDVGAAAPVVIWLTRRLLQRMLPVLLQWLERQDAETPRADVLHSFAQQAARAELEPQAPVQASGASAAWLALAVDVSRSEQAVGLTWRGADGQMASLELAAKPLRQWLGIVHDAYVRGDWALDAWPAWLCESARPAAPQSALLH